MPVPSIAYIGTTFSASVSSTKHNSDDWTAVLRFTAAGLTDIEIDGTGNGKGGFTFTATTAVTALWITGRYNWAMIVSSESSGVMDVAFTGSINIAAIGSQKPALADAEANLKSAEDELAARVAGGGVVSSSHQGGSFSLMTTDEIIKAIDYWRKRVKSLRASDDCANGRGNRRITYGRIL